MFSYIILLEMIVQIYLFLFKSEISITKIYLAFFFIRNISGKITIVVVRNNIYLKAEILSIIIFINIISF